MPPGCRLANSSRCREGEQEQARNRKADHHQERMALNGVRSDWQHCRRNGRYQRRRSLQVLVRLFLDGQHEPVAAPVYGLDHARLTCVITEGLAQFLDRSGQNRFRHRHAGPDEIEQVAFRHQDLRVLHEHFQQM
jgi:hypothetical protein